MFESLKKRKHDISIFNSSCKNCPNSAAARHAANSFLGMVSKRLLGATRARAHNTCDYRFFESICVRQ